MTTARLPGAWPKSKQVVSTISHSDDDIPLLVALFDIPMSFDDLARYPETQPKPAVVTPGDGTLEPFEDSGLGLGIDADPWSRTQRTASSPRRCNATSMGLRFPYLTALDSRLVTI